MDKYNIVSGVYTREFENFLGFSDEEQGAVGGDVQVRVGEILSTSPRLYNRRSTAESIPATARVTQTVTSAPEPKETQDDLIRRLRAENAALKQAQWENTIAENTEMRQRIRVLENSMNQTTNYSFNFREIQETITPFSGDGNEEVDAWIVDMESTAVALGWSQQQLFVYGKNNLKGTARLAMSGRHQVTSWLTLKKCLKEEFQREVTMIEIHRTMVSRKWRKEESLLHYYYEMQRLGARGLLSDVDVIRYIIEGIQDTPYNKAVLYGCTGLTEFKKKLEMYQQIRSDANRKQYRDNAGSSKAQEDEEKREGSSRYGHERRCFQCGENSHLRHECKNPPKCYSCGEVGHISPLCPKKETNATVSLARPSGEGVAANKRLKVNGQEMDALIDTGSDINIISTEAVRKLEICHVHPTGMRVNGVGAKDVPCRGVFDAHIEVDGHTFCTKVYVFDEDVIPTRLIIGTELLAQAELIINQDGIKISKRVDNEVKQIRKDEVQAEDGCWLKEPGPVYEAKLKGRIVNLEKQVERLKICNKSLLTDLVQSKEEKEKLRANVISYESTTSEGKVGKRDEIPGGTPDSGVEQVSSILDVKVKGRKKWLNLTDLRESSSRDENFRNQVIPRRITVQGGESVGSRNRGGAPAIPND